MKRWIVVLLAAGALCAQPPIMRRRPAGGAGPGRSPGTTEAPGTEARSSRTPGSVVSVGPKQLVLSADDGRELTAALTKETVFTKPAAELHAGDRVTLEYRKADDGSPIALRVEFEKAAAKSCTA